MIESMAEVRARNVSRETVTTRQQLNTWTDEQLDRLRYLRLDRELPTDTIADIIGRTHGAVRTKLCQLGIVLRGRRK